MKLYEIIDFVPTPTEEWMAHEAAQQLYYLAYNRQTGDSDGRRRNRGRKEMVFIYYYKAHASEFHNYSDTSRLKESLSAAGLPEDHIISSELQRAVDSYEHLIKTGNKLLGLLESARHAVNKLKSNFTNVKIEIDSSDSLDVMEKKINITGKLMDNLGKIPKVIKDLDAIEERVMKDVSNVSRLKGGAEKGRL